MKRGRRRTTVRALSKFLVRNYADPLSEAIFMEETKK